jgi:hypothetical protein
MATKKLSVSLTRELQGSIERRIRCGLYGDGSYVAFRAIGASTNPLFTGTLSGHGFIQSNPMRTA